MNILPRTWFSGRKSNDIGSSAVARAGMALGPWSEQINGFIPRQNNPWFFEALREALGVLDGAINRLVTVDGLLAVEGGNDKLVQAIQTGLLDSIPVSDLQGGMHAFYSGQGNELYEQGFTVGEMVFDRRGRELIGLRVADSKGVLFHRDVDTGQLQTWYLPPLPNAAGRKDGTDAMETVLRNSGRTLNASVIQGKGYTLIDPNRMVYAAFNPENDQPYGVSLLRSIEFVGQILLKMHNATGQAWDRFGDPVFHVNYKTKNRALKDDALESRRKKLAGSLQSALNIKRSGNSADFVTAVGADDDVAVTIIGGDGKVLNIEMPARHMLEQVLAKASLPAWMLGMQFSTAERMADNQAEVVLQESKTRFEARKHGLNRVVETWLRGRGLTWKPGDWQLVQRLPNLRDELKRAQAAFLNAQTAMMAANGGQVPAAPAGTDPQSDPGAKQYGTLDDLDPIVIAALRGMVSKQAPHVHKASGGEQWAIDDPELPRLTTAAVAAAQAAWAQLASDTLAALSLPATKAPGDVFVWDSATMLQKLLNLQSDFIIRNSRGDSALARLVFEIWQRGLTETLAAATPTETTDTLVTQARERYSAALPTNLQQVLQKTTVREYEQGIVKALQDGTYNGTKPTEVARQLRKQFGNANYNWERLATSEMGASHADGELAALTASGITQYDWLLSPDACSICVGIEKNGPYTVGAGPMPMRDSHPMCACVITAHYPEA
ncbi:hypothetical protein [Dyella sp.]|uniref:hypothetical protein n=1 Tax=Dyella sp. TaxID=1869338 RepID=UPI003F8224A1